MIQGIFRRAEPQETDVVFDLIEQRVQWMDEKDIRQWNVTNYLNAYPIEYYEEQQQKGILYVLENGGIIGTVVLLEEDERWKEQEKGSALYIHNLATDPKIRGAGRILLQEAERLAAEQEKQFVRLDCPADNKILNEYYESKGYGFFGQYTEGPYTGNLRQKRIKNEI